MPCVISEKLVRLMARADRTLIFTGAGISTGSGIPDFRGPDGVWKTRQPVFYQDFMTSEAARIEHWEYKLEASEAFRDAEPTKVHRAIGRFEPAGKLFRVVTQNIDGLHQKAGTSRERVIELHGSNSEVECQTCHRRSDPDMHFETFRETRVVPTCHSCGGFLKLGTISFGQNLREADIVAAEEAGAEADLVLALGTTLSVYPAASIPLAAAERGIPYVIMNRGPTEHDAHPCVTLRLEGDVEELFPPTVDAVLA